MLHGFRYSTMRSPCGSPVQAKWKMTLPCRRSVIWLLPIHPLRGLVDQATKRTLSGILSSALFLMRAMPKK